MTKTHRLSRQKDTCVISFLFFLPRVRPYRDYSNPNSHRRTVGSTDPYLVRVRLTKGVWSGRSRARPHGPVKGALFSSDEWPLSSRVIGYAALELRRDARRSERDVRVSASVADRFFFFGEERCRG